MAILPTHYAVSFEKLTESVDSIGGWIMDVSGGWIYLVGVCVLSFPLLLLWHLTLEVFFWNKWKMKTEGESANPGLPGKWPWTRSASWSLQGPILRQDDYWPKLGLSISSLLAAGHDEIMVAILWGHTLQYNLRLRLSSSHLVVSVGCVLTSLHDSRQVLIMIFSYQTITVYK